MAAAFFLSGAAALIYELLWFRQLGYVFGSTATATATLLSAYLFGLGLGAWIFGLVSDRLRQHLLVYLAIEAAIGVYGFASYGLLQSASPLYAMAHGWAADSPGRLLLARFGISFILIAIPTTLMGGTFPLMVHLLRGPRVDVGQATGLAYAVNTAGAALGALSLPSVLLPGLGVRASLATAAAGNFGAVLCAFVHSRRLASATAVSGAQDAPAVPAEFMAGVVSETGADRGAVPVLAGFLLSSFAALALETVWTRHLGLFFGAQIYTFAFVLFAYLVGLFLGGAAYARLLARGSGRAPLLCAGLLLAATGVGVVIPVLDRLPLPQIKMMLALGVSFRTFLLTSALETIGLILIPAVGFGLVFPAVVDILSRGGRRTGLSVGLAYAVNTLGSTAGAIVAGFVLVPTIGTQRTLEIAVLLIAGALALSWPRRTGSTTRAVLRVGVPAAFLLVLAWPRWDWRFAHAMYAKDPLLFLQRYTGGLFAPWLAGLRVSYLAEAAQATVSVCDFGTTGLRSLFINGKPDASNFPDDLVTQRLLAYVPALFHPGPKNALVIGLGSGTTVGSLEQFPLVSVDAAEISPEVVEAARLYFADINGGFLADPRLKVHLEDGRTFLHFSPPSSYDLIISEPSNPWMAGISALFSDEFFADVRTKLRPGGIFCQWFYYYSTSLEHIRLVMRTFSRHFPDAAVFALRGEHVVGDILLIGSNAPLRLARLPDDPSLPDPVRAGLAGVRNAGAQELLSSLVAASGDVARFAGEGPLNTDDRPILELEAPADRFIPSAFQDNLRAMLTAGQTMFVAAGPTAAESPASAEVAHDGFDPALPLPEGVERHRGAIILTRVHPAGDEIRRWVLLGREFEQKDSSTTLYRLVPLPEGPGEILDIATAFAGPGRSIARGETSVNGHPGVWVASESDSDRTVALGWFCAEQKRGFFVSRRVVLSAASPAPEIASELAARFPCAHATR